MNKKLGKIISVLATVLTAAAIFLVSFFYIKTISDNIYKDSTNQLKETYKIVGRSAKSYFVNKWNILNDWKDSVNKPDFDFKTKKDEWRFSDFYFINKTGDGKVEWYSPISDKLGSFSSGESWSLLFDAEKINSDRWIVEGENAADGGMSVIFAVPTDSAQVKMGQFKTGNDDESEPTDPSQDQTENDDKFETFDYSAIAIGFTNQTVTDALDTKPYKGMADCFVIHSDGRVLFSFKEDNFNRNYLDYLRTPTNEVDGEVVDNIENDMKAGGEENLVTVEIGGVDHYIYYQKMNNMNNQDYYIFSVIPQKTISSGFLSVQRNTSIILIVIFIIVSVAVLSIMIILVYRRNKSNSAELKYREKLFDVLSNTVNDIFIMLDAHNERVEYISPNIERLLGIRYKDARESIRNLAKCAVNFDIIVPKSELESIPDDGSKFWECEYIHQNTGERRWYRVTIYHKRIQGVEKFIVVMSDRTVENQMNKTLKEAFDAANSANEAKSNFLSNMSHDIRTPMNAIVGFSLLLEEHADDPEKVREYTRKITASGHHLLGIINDVLDMSKIENGKTSLNNEKFSLPKFIEEMTMIIMSQARAKGQDLSVVVKGNPPEEIIGDSLRLNRILMNILSNAIKYTPEGGKIDFVITTLPQPSPQLCKLRFTVTDNGIGMSPEFVEHIFEPFEREINSVTNKIQGTGLGMAITKSLVDLMGGIIIVESEPDKGSTFTVELSFTIAERQEADAWYKHRIERMLVADDEQDICLSVKETMEGTDVEVGCVFSGAEAVEAAGKAHDEGKDYDVILLDWKMPGMDGVEAARRIRERTNNEVPILVLTSYDWASIEDEARAAGIDAFMSKPFFVSTFWETMRELFEKQEGIQSSAEVDKNDDVLKGKSFLVVEDNDLNAEIITEMLGMEGAKSDLAVNGKEAVEKFLSEDPNKYDLILMDVQMPIMNGYQATEAIRSSQHPRAATIPIVAMTANAFAEDVRKTLDAGMDGHLSKPIDMAKIKEVVGKLLAKKGEDKKDNEGKGDK